MQPLQIVIEGTDAVDAAKALMVIPNLSGDWQTPNATQREGVLAVIATIVGIVGGTLAAAEQIRKWYQERKKANSGKTITKAVLVGKDKRVLLEGATAQEIKAVLDSLG
jgi:hypothetical protein